MTSFLLIVCLTAGGCCSLLAQNLPAGAILEARLSRATGSRLSHCGDPIKATVIAPVFVAGRTMIPAKSKLYGSVTEVNRLGLGLKHTTASLGYRFDSLQLPSGETIPVRLQLFQVETAKERVDDRGIVLGIHPIVGLASALAFFTVPLSFVSPVLSAPVWGIKSIIAPSANPEIDFPPGTELLLHLMENAQIPHPAEGNSHMAVLTRSETLLVQHSLESLTQRRAFLRARPSDWINLIFLGNRQQIDRAFQAAGWTEAHRRSPVSLYRMYLALTKRKGYPKAPMNPLTLAGVPSDLAYQKSLDTLEKRHHIRLWKDPQRPDVWLSAAAEDVGLRFRSAHWTHATNPDTDSEQAKVVNDLAFTGCVEEVGLLPRLSSSEASPFRLVMAQNAKVTAVIRLNNCGHPDVMAGVLSSPMAIQQRRLYRALCSFRDDLIRSNVFFLTYNTVRVLTKDRNRSVSVTTDRAVHNLNWLTSQLDFLHL